MATPKAGSSKGGGRARKTTRERTAGRAGGAAPAEPAKARAGAGAADAGSADGPRVREAAQEAAGAAAQAAGRAATAAATAAREASRRVVEAAPTIVLKAASIIEEEVAMGIGAVKRITQRFLDVDELRAQGADHVMSRFRKDAHEAVDVLLDIATAAAATVGERAGKMVNVTASHVMPGAGSPSDRPQAGAGPADAGATRLQTVRMPGAVAPGSDVELMMSLENDRDSSTAEFTLHSSELVSAAGARIPASAVMFEPATLSVGPRAAGSVTVRVRVPADARPGSYEGLLRATALDGLRAMLTVTVG